MGATTSAVAERQAGQSFIDDPLSTVERDRSAVLWQQYEDLLLRQVTAFVAHLPQVAHETDAFIECRPQLLEGSKKEGAVRRSSYFEIRKVKRKPMLLVRHVMKRLTWPNESFWLGRSTCHLKRNPTSSEDNSRWCFAFVADFDRLDDLGALLRHFRAQCIPEPSLIISTGGGFHCYWHLRQPIPARLARDVHWQFLRRIQHPKADMSSDQVSRCFRMPGAPNLKREAIAEIVPGFDHPSRKFDLHQLVPGATLPPPSYMIDLLDHEKEELEEEAARRREIRAAVEAANPDVTDWRELDDLVRAAITKQHIQSRRIGPTVRSSKMPVAGPISAAGRSWRSRTLAPRPSSTPSPGWAPARKAPFPEIAPEAIDQLAGAAALTEPRTRHRGIARLIYMIRRVGACSLEVGLEIHDKWYGRNAKFIKSSIETSRQEFREAWTNLKYLHCRRNFIDVVLDNLHIHPGLEKIDSLQQEERGRPGAKKDYAAMKALLALVYSATLVHPEGTPRLSIRTLYDGLLLLGTNHTHTLPSSFVTDWGRWLEVNPKSRMRAGTIPSLNTIAHYLHVLIRLELIESVELRPADPRSRVANSYTISEQWRKEKPGSLCSMAEEEVDDWRKRRAEREKPVPEDWSAMTVEERKDDRRRRMEERKCWRRVVAQVREVICREIRERSAQRRTQEPADGAEACRVAPEDADVVHGALAPTGLAEQSVSPCQVGVEKDESMAMALMGMLEERWAAEERAEARVSPGEPSQIGRTSKIATALPRMPCSYRN